MPMPCFYYVGYKLNLNLNTFTFCKSKTLDINEVKKCNIHTAVVGTILLCRVNLVPWT